MAKKKKKILFAYDAYWFLHNHPAFRIRDRYLVRDPESPHSTKRMVKCENGVYYTETVHSHRLALDCNLDVFYARVDETGTINDDKTKNRYTEVWLEFGPIYWTSDHERECNEYRIKEAEEHGWSKPWQTDLTNPDLYVDITHSHDYHLDCGAPTYDEALVKLANLVLKHYGDYEDDEDEVKTCGGVEKCPDCKYMSGLKWLRNAGHLELKHESDMTEEERARPEEL